MNPSDTPVKSNVTILGAGGWGIAIANLLALKKLNIILWEYDKAAAEKLKSDRTLPQKLPGIKINPDINISNNIVSATQNSHFIICAVPAQFLRSALSGLKGRVMINKPVFVNLAKGIEINSLKRMSQVIEETIHPENYSGIATLSGPSHAEEVARDMPTAIVAASGSKDIALEVQGLFSAPRFRVYTSTDIIGVELAGSLKNVIALASGMLDGLELGDNTKGALLTRGLAEITRMGRTLGADSATFSGLSGIGDLVTTCLSRHSRNRFVGEQIGRGRKLSMVLEALPMVAEGVETTKSAKKLADLHKVEMPIIEHVFKVLFEDKPPAEAITELMTRGLRPEIWG
jgi:glycerol-3-phosphate dehydrogenase (NAD(P)+)